MNSLNCSSEVCSGSLHLGIALRFQWARRAHEHLAKDLYAGWSYRSEASWRKPELPRAMGGLDSRANDLLKAQRREILLSGEGFQRANSINASLTQISQQHRRTGIL